MTAADALWTVGELSATFAQHNMTASDRAALLVSIAYVITSIHHQTSAIDERLAHILDTHDLSVVVDKLLTRHLPSAADTGDGQLNMTEWYHDAVAAYTQHTSDSSSVAWRMLVTAGVRCAAMLTDVLTADQRQSADAADSNSCLQSFNCAGDVRWACAYPVGCARALQQPNLRHTAVVLILE